MASVFYRLFCWLASIITYEEKIGDKFLWSFGMLHCDALKCVGQLTTFPLEITCHLVDLKKTSLACEVIVFKKFFFR